jgi:hypothetical protein
MLDSRYHIIYLVVIFLVLGFGIIIGSSLDVPAQLMQQHHALTTLQAQVDGAVQDGKVARERLSQMETAMESIRPRLVRGVLAGNRVAMQLTSIDVTDIPGVDVGDVVTLPARRIMTSSRIPRVYFD